MNINFCDIEIEGKFVYDGDTFIKTDTSIAWELREGRMYKEWAFRPDDQCRIP